MLIELYIFFEVIAIGLFISSFFTKQEILWGITIVLFGVLMYTSYNVEYYVYNWNITVQAYEPIVASHSYPYLMGLNLLFFVLGMLLGIFDLFDKYGMKFAKNK
jgi:hypothetical protein